MGLRRNAAGVFSALRGDDNMRYRIAERVAAAIHPEAILSGRDRIWLKDEEVRSVFRRFKGTTANRQLDRVYFLDQLAGLASQVDGDTVECGSFEGLTSYMICRRTQPGRHHHVFDSFEGVSEPTEVDGTYWTEGELAASEATVQANLAGFDVTTYKGWIPDRFDEVADRTFALVHIDVDLYRPTRDSVEFFYDRTVPGGLIVCDDYGFGTCPGAKRAIDEHMADKPEIVVSVPTGQGLIIKAWT